MSRAGAPSGHGGAQVLDLPELRDAPLTYPEVGATLVGPPTGYQHQRVSRVLGVGAPAFELAAHRLLTWQLHGRAGVRVQASDAVARVGAVCRLGIGLGPLRLWAACRVVVAVDEPRRRGFAYGTLPGHPERGEELFLVEQGEDDRVVLRIVSFSRPGTWWSALAQPLAAQVQEVVTARYLHALVDPSAGPSAGPDHP